MPAAEGSEEAKRAVANAMRLVRRNALAKQSASARSRLALRRMVAERLSHPLLEQMHSAEFAKNPLAEEEGPDEAVEIGRRLEEVRRELLAVAGITEEEAAEPEDEAEEVTGEDAAAMAAFEARFVTGRSSPTGTAMSGSAPADGGLLDVSSSELDDLVRLKGMVQAHDVSGIGLDAQEFVAALGQMWTTSSPMELMRLFMQIDADSDGREREHPPATRPPTLPPPPTHACAFRRVRCDLGGAAHLPASEKPGR